MTSAGANGGVSNESSRSQAPKRKAPDAAGAPRMKVPRREGPTPVQSERNTFWDKISPNTMSRAEIRKRFFTAAERWEQLDKYKLLYEYSSIEDTELRLLYINPAPRRENDLFVSIRKIADSKVGLDPLQEYEALSYHWGPGPADKPVYLADPDLLPKIGIGDLLKLKMFVPDYVKGQRFYVRSNLDKALRYLRHTTETMILWVDAICINQSDEKIEKPAQIAKMKQIYNKATNVCIWLGDGKNEGKEDRSEDFHAAMNFSREILDLKNLEELSKDNRVTKKWSDLLDLMRCSWFSRRWVIQELALAQEATVHCGERYVHWQDFADAIGLFVVKFDNIRALFRQSQDDKIFRNYQFFNELEPLGAKLLVDAITNTFRKSVDGNIFEPVSDLETLVSSLATFESSDPRDTIFALLNIARESLLPGTRMENTVGPPKPNYERNLLEVYTDFLEWVVHSTNSLDIICRQWAIPERRIPGGRKNPTELVTLPSWVQTISKSTWGTQEEGFNGRINGDSLVGRAGRKRYNASHGKKPEVRFGVRFRQNPDPQEHASRVNSAPSRFGENNGNGAPPIQERFDYPFGKESPSHRLHAKGIQIDIVNWTVGPVSKGVITKECLERGGWKNDGQPIIKAPDKLWRTLVADRNAEGENPPPWYHRAALHSVAVAAADNNGHISTEKLLDQVDSLRQNIPQIAAEYLKRVQAVTWNRKFLEGTPQAGDSELLFGLGPPETQKDDHICILFGCSVPCILRPRSCKNGAKYFQFIGEAYIYGRMDGEAITLLSAEELKTKTKEYVIM